MPEVEEDFIALSEADDDLEEFVTPPSTVQTYDFDGVRVRFPFPAYHSQLRMMEAIVKTLNAGKAHALLESPTGSGKSLALLCAVCGWLEHQKRLLLTSEKPKKPKTSCGDCKGGGGCGAGEGSEQDFVSVSEEEEAARLPRVYICSRTHRQIAQLIKEMRRTGYADTLQYTVLASRQHLCISETAKIAPDLNEYCRENMTECIYYKKLAQMLNKPTAGKPLGNRDVEELVEFGRKRTVCPYFLARESLGSADLIFSPYNYCVDPLIRGAMGINLEGAILMVDEAHNTEDACREAATFECNEIAANAVVGELGRLVVEMERAGAAGLSTLPKLPCLRAQLEAATLLRTMIAGLVLTSDLPKPQVRDSFDGNHQIWRGEHIQPLLRGIGINRDQVKLWADQLERLIEEADGSSENRRKKKGKKEKDLDADPSLSAGSSQLLKGKVALFA